MSDTGLSVGAKAGIGVGAGLGGLGALGALGLLIFRLGKAAATKQGKPVVADLGDLPRQKPELEAGDAAIGATRMQTHANMPQLVERPGGASYAGYPTGEAELGDEPRQKLELEAGGATMGAAEIYTHTNTPELGG